MHILFAHAFGQVYNLPVPLWLYLYAGAAAVVLSFVVVGWVVEKPKVSVVSERQIIGPSVANRFIAQVLRLISATVTLAVLFAGVLGTQDPNANIVTTFLWITFYLGQAYLTLIFGDYWAALHPVRSLLALVETSLGHTLKPLAPFPRQLGTWPATVGYILLIWLETLSSGWAVVPANLSRIVLGYLVITLGGALLYGEDWFHYGDTMSVFFRQFGHLAGVVYKKAGVYLRKPILGLLSETVSDFGLVFFILFMLSSTAFDGLRDTQAFGHFYNWLLVQLPILARTSPSIIKSIILVLSPLVFFLIYWLFVWIMKTLVPTKKNVRQLLFDFAPTLVPIAVAYNIAHYYTLLVIQGQLLIKLISDPLGHGWNLFGTSDYRINVGILNAATVWYSQVALIVLGHIAAVYLAHLVALKVWPKTKQALASQYPMLLLMVIYTMVSLWIIAQPITKG